MLGILGDMNTTHLTLIACAAIAAGGTTLSSSHRASEIRRTTFSFRESASMTEMQLTQNGEEMPDMMQMEQDRGSTRNGSFIDTTLKVEDGQRLSFDRQYVDLEQVNSMSFSGPMGDDQSNDFELSSSLNGLRVRFDLEEDEFKASYADEEEGEDEWLEGLEAELPWAAFIPEGEVEVGDSWELDAASFMQAIDFGGDLVFTDGSDDSRAGMMEPPSGDDDVEYEGSITAKLTALEDIDGVSHAVISLVIDISSVHDLTEFMAEMAANPPEDVPAGMVMPDIDLMEIETALSGEGTLSWNLAAGHLESLSVEYDTEVIETVVLSVEMGPDVMEMEQAMTFEGETSFTVEVEVTDE